LLVLFFVLCITKKELEGLDFSIAGGFSVLIGTELLGHVVFNFYPSTKYVLAQYSSGSSTIVACLIWLRAFSRYQDIQALSSADPFLIVGSLHLDEELPPLRRRNNLVGEIISPPPTTTVNSLRPSPNQ